VYVLLFRSHELHVSIESLLSDGIAHRRAGRVEKVPNMFADGAVVQ
jgi:hypothetical protein